MEIKRDFYLKQLIEAKQDNLIKVITGIRRCGKSYLLNTIFYNYLIENAVNEDHIIKIALDDKANSELLDADRLDGYIPKFNIAIEYDESQHFIEPQKSQDIIRQKEIEKALKCNFVRCDYRNTDAYNIGLVLNEIINRKEVI